MNLKRFLKLFEFWNNFKILYKFSLTRVYCPDFSFCFHYSYYFYFSLSTESLCVRVIAYWIFRCSATEAVKLISKEHSVYNNFGKCSGLLLDLFFLFAFILRNCMYKSHLLFKYKVFRERSGCIAFSVENFVCSNFKMYTFRILFFSFASIYPNCICKSIFS